MLISVIQNCLISPFSIVLCACARARVCVQFSFLAKPEWGWFVPSSSRSIPQSLFHYFQSKGSTTTSLGIQSREIVPVIRAFNDRALTSHGNAKKHRSRDPDRYRTELICKTPVRPRSGGIDYRYYNIVHLFMLCTVLSSCRVKNQSKSFQDII